MARARDPREALLSALRDLEENNFKILKYHLRNMTPSEDQPHLYRGELEGLSRVELASQLILMYGAHEAVKVVLKGLTVMHLLELVDQLSSICLNDYREIYREHVRCLEERQEGKANGTFHQVLLVAKPSSGSPESPTCPFPEQELDTVTLEALFGPGEKPYREPCTVVLLGSAGTGKTTLAQKMLLDWATGTLYLGQFDYIFFVSCREVGLLSEGNLDQLLFWCCGDNQAPVEEILRQPERILFLLDGFDELQRPFTVGLKRLRCSPMEKILHLLVRRERLAKCSLLITTRPLAMRDLEPLLKQPHQVHILGFSEKERRRYFSSFFADEEQARDAFDFVQGNDVLYKACQVPGICWVVCSWLQGQMERGRTFSETPTNITDIYMAYISTFLPCNENEACSELPRHSVLRGLCSLAAEGIQHQRFLFEDADLRKHNLDGHRLAAFLSSHNYQEGFAIRKFYSFCHISFQEFFHAMSYLVKEDHNQLGEESRREVERLLEIKGKEGNKEMTLTMQFLLDIWKKEGSSNAELKFCFKIPPCIMKDLKYFKEQMKSIKHKSTWDLEFSLYESKMKNLVKGIQMTDISFKVGRSNERNSCSGHTFSVKTSLTNGQKEGQKHPLIGKGTLVGTEKETSSGKCSGTVEQEPKEVWSSETGMQEMRTVKLKDGVEGQEDWGRRDRGTEGRETISPQGCLEPPVTSRVRLL